MSDGDLNDDGSQNNDGEGNQPAWTAQLSDNLKTNESLTQFKTISDLGNAYIDSKGKLQNAVQIPGENATSDEKSAYFSKLGRPEQASGYEIEKPDFPEGYVYDEAFEGHFKDTAHKYGLPKEATKGLYKDLLTKSLETWTKGKEALAKEDAESEKALKNEWGINFDTNSEQVKRAETKFSEKNGDFIKLMAEAGLNNHPSYKKFMNGLFQKLSDDSWVKGDSSNLGQKGKPLGIDGKPMLDFSKSMGD